MGYICHLQNWKISQTFETLNLALREPYSEEVLTLISRLRIYCPLEKV